jgi:hypothetical protein
MKQQADANGPFEFQLLMLEKSAWVAMMGWAFTAKISIIVLLGFVVLVGFWLLEALFKGIQLRYIDQSSMLGDFLNDAAQVEDSFVKKRLPQNSVYPIAVKETELQGAVRLGRGMITPTIVTLYLFLGLINLFIWMVVSTTGFKTS